MRSYLVTRIDRGGLLLEAFAFRDAGRAGAELRINQERPVRDFHSWMDDTLRRGFRAKDMATRQLEAAILAAMRSRNGTFVQLTGNVPGWLAHLRDLKGDR